MKRKLVLISIALAIGFSSCQKKEAPIEVAVDQEVITFSDKIIPGSWIIVYNDLNSFKKMPADANSRNELVLEVSKNVFKRASVEFTQPTYVYGSSIRGLAMKLSDKEVLRLQDDPDIKGVYPDKMVTLGHGGGGGNQQPDQVIPYGVIRTGYGNYMGENKAWIIDTGIDLDHPDLNVDQTNGASFVDYTTSPEDDNGHGTHCAGIVAAYDNDIGVVGVAAGATVVPIKVLDRSGRGANSQIIAGIDFVAANAAVGDVANLSLGGSTDNAMDEAVVKLGDEGIYVALAAGNDSEDANEHSPARAEGDNLYTVSAMDINDNWAYFSNYGNPPIDYCAPGVSIYSTYKRGRYTSMSGTSMSAPHVCGLLLLTNGTIRTDGTVNFDPDDDPDPIAHN